MRRAWSSGRTTLIPVTAGVLPGSPGAPGPFDGKPATCRGGVLRDHGIGLPLAQALAALGVVLVLDADHVTGRKRPGWHLLSGHGPPGKIAAITRTSGRPSIRADLRVPGKDRANLGWVS